MSNSLPDHAHPGHLKKQAKALLKACHDSRSDALRRMTQHHPSYAKGIPEPGDIRLQETQHVVACEYGASSWSALMAQLNPENAKAKPEPSGILLFTNGSSAVDLFQQAGIPGQKEEWVDVLHDGPVPLTTSPDELNRIRASYLSRLGWSGFDGIMSGFQKRDQLLAQPDAFSELQLWFEHDLFDQLLVIQLIDRIAEIPEWIPKTRLWQFDSFIGRLTPETLTSACPQPASLTPQQIDEARRAWQAFRSPDPQALMMLLEQPLSSLPYLKSALRRLREEFPSEQNGLGRTEQQILEALRERHHSPQSLFRYNQEQEEAVFMGDGTFYLILERLTQGAQPLVELKNASRFLHPGVQGYTDAFRNQYFDLTPNGEQALKGKLNWLACMPASYWIGGCEIRNDFSI